VTSKVLLAGPYPPPHGGVSVHVEALCRELRESGVACRVVDTDPRRGSAPPPAGGDPIGVRGGFDLARVLWRHARDGYTVHLHTNGHNRKSWLLALAAGIVARRAPGSVLTLHSGMLPSYLARPWRLRRGLARLACAQYSWIVCVNTEVRDALVRLGVPLERLRVVPAFFPPRVKSGPLDASLESWLARHSPVLSTALFFRPEYGFDLLVEAAARLRTEYPLLGLAVMGSGARDEPETLVRRRGLHGAVRLAGDLAHDDCVKLMARSDAFVRATRADGDSISVREAVALGVPTVASDVGTRPEGVHLFPAGDVEGLVESIRSALRQRRRIVRGGPDIVRHLLALYGGGGDNGDSWTPEFWADLGRSLTRPRDIVAYARASIRR
jgi:glycogen(starch) synthase